MEPGDSSGILGDDILCVDDTSPNLQLLIHILGRAGYRVRYASNGELALRTVEAALPALILLDVNMPGMDGYEVCRRLKADEKTRSIPIIFVSALESEYDKVKGFQAGGADYVTKPFHVDEILARVNTHLTLRRVQMDLEAKNLALQAEIGAHKQTESQLRWLSFHDKLTGLYSRNYFEEEMVRLEHGRRLPVSILMADVDRMKETNDREGHAAGDALLKRVARLLSGSFRSEDVVARIGGDEFAVLLPGTDAESAQSVLRRLRHVLQEQNAAHPKERALGISFGVSTSEEGVALSDVLKNADRAMYLEKEEHRAGNR
jgi:two-component system cell cycle response regulator